MIALAGLAVAGCTRPAAVNPYEAASATERAAFTRVAIPLPSGLATHVRQGAFGASSHDEPGNEYSWDFEVPFGTAVLAAETGVVIDVWTPAGGGACDPTFAELAHNVKIRHDNGTVAQYVHVAPLVELGQVIARGQELARTANNGWLCYPHLHFGVYASDRQLYTSAQRKTIPLAFVGVSGEIVREGTTYAVPRSVDEKPRLQAIEGRQRVLRLP